MANEKKRLIPCGEKVTLNELLPGTIFAFGDDCIAVKSEYRCKNGLIEAFIISSGEQFWGGAKTVREQIALMVQPLEIEEVDAVEVVRCKDCKHFVSPQGVPCCDEFMGLGFPNPSGDDFCSYGERREGE